MSQEKKIYFNVDEKNHKAVKAARELIDSYGQAPLSKADVIVNLGGDGTMLRAMQVAAVYQKPVYGMNRGHVGALLNAYHPDDLYERLAAAQEYVAPALEVTGITSGGDFKIYAFNEMTLQTSIRPQEADLSVFYGANRLFVSTDDKVYPLNGYRLRGNGLLISTCLGSEAYNKKSGGYVLSLDEKLLAVTSLNSTIQSMRGMLFQYLKDKVEGEDVGFFDARGNPFEPKALLEKTATFDVAENFNAVRHILLDNARIHIRVNSPQTRPILLVADHFEQENVLQCDIKKSDTYVARVLFDNEKKITHQQHGDEIKANRMNTIMRACSGCRHNTFALTASQIRIHSSKQR